MQQQQTAVLDERRLQDTLIKSMGDFAYALPNYQKLEVMMFILGKIPASLKTSGYTPLIAARNMSIRNPRDTDRYLQNVLVKTLLHVATKWDFGML